MRAFIVFFLGCADVATGFDTSEPIMVGGFRQVIYLQPGYIWDGGVENTARDCMASLDGDYRKIDYSGCCPEGFTPVGRSGVYGGSTNIACLQDR
jgi:hypothetical protein